MGASLDWKWGKPDRTHDPAILSAFQARPTDVLWLRCEDMKQDLPAGIDRLLAFLGWGRAVLSNGRMLYTFNFH